MENIENTEPVQNSTVTIEKSGISPHAFAKLAKLTIANNQMLLHQQHVLEEIQQILGQLTNNLPKTQQDTSKILVNEEVENFKRKNFPLKDEEALEGFENILSEAGRDIFKDSMVKSLSKEGSAHYKEAVCRIMAAVLADNLAISFSFQGHEQKKTFSCKQLAQIVIEAVQHCSRDNVMTKDVEVEMAIWLAKTKERQQKRSNKNHMIT